MNRFKLVHVALVLIVIVTSVSIVIGSSEKKVAEKNPVLENIYTRSSVRSYQKRAVEDEKVEQVLRAAMSAPSAVNKQPWAFIVVKERSQLDSLASKLPHAQMLEEAALAIVVCGDLSKALEGEAQSYWIQDVSAATENLLLAAHGLGLGAVWTGVYPIKERVVALQKLLKLPETVIPLNVVPIGYPQGKPNPKNKWKPENIHYEKW